MKGILLAGGSGTRLYPATLAVCKQLLPLFDKPMIYYPLSILMLAEIRDILIISTPEDTPRFQKLFGDGSQIGLRLRYAVQPHPGGLAQALLIGAPFIDQDPVALILGDNVFYGNDLENLLNEGKQLLQGGLIFGYRVKDPQRYGVVEFDSSMKAIRIEEKPKTPKSSYAVPGLYFYGPEAVEMARTLKPSPRGELEITDLHQMYLERGELTVRLLHRGHAWLDTGTFEAYNQASGFIQAIQERQGIKIACIEEIAYRKGWIDASQMERLAERFSKNEYGEYLRGVLQETNAPQFA
jgi:glucose-1-phosphate thymidylyltransferase